uniref:DNA helicase Pif1-like 2B domain-containing protein n=1 Tax=Ananas comosus var. bracteatus TaxID=296719 RepID=A0A6V7PGK8_ANACO|nr:unnamed protein product [Ananas comosus var. bracteatus]
MLYPVDFLNSLKFNGILNHEIKLKVGAPIMLLRNINQSFGLCNDVRRVGLFIPQPVFSHGHLYVAVSRITSREGLRIFIDNKDDKPQGHTRNVVYRENISKPTRCFG